jgi:cystathionine beta-lyase
MNVETLRKESLELSIPFLRSRRNSKWQRYGDEVLPAPVAEMDFSVAAPIRAAMERIVREQDYGYPHREGSLSHAFVRRMRNRFGWHTEAADTLPIADLVQGTFACVLAFSEPGDTVVLQMPSYPPFQNAVHETGRVLQEDRMRDDGTHFVSDFSELEAATGPRARVMLFCHPQNPTGRAYSRAELETIGRFAVRHDLVIMSDEIHADLVYPGRTHIPLASISPEVAARTITTTSATKGFNIPGLRCGVLHFGSPELKARFVKRIPPRLLGSPGITGIDATVAAWDDGQPWCDEVLAMLQRNRDWLAGAVAREFPGAVMRLPEATYLAWIDFTRLGLPGPAGTFFLEQAKVALSPGENFGAQYGNFARLNFATSPAILEQIVARMAAAVRALR